MQWFFNLSALNQAILATLFTWGVTALGASLVIFFKKINKIVLDGMLGFAAGVMIAASFWSLLAPAIDLAQDLDMVSWLMVAFGFLSGGGFLYIADKLLPHQHPGGPDEEVEGIHSSWNRSILLVMAITLHNIPEGLAIGVAFGAASLGLGGTTIGALALAIGIGLQNFPEGAAVSVPLRREGMSRFKAFFYGQASGIVEPISAIIGVLLVTTMQRILPFALAFAAGAMIFVVVEELIPESQRSHHNDFSTIMTMIGFTVMMILDVALS